MCLMKPLKKITLFAAAALFAAANLFALPGAQKSVPDASGEYVYYRDSSFNRESYIGFLYYDDSTYEARYYAPATEALAEKNIDMLFSVAQKNGRMELTGERFVIPPQQDDVAIVNYIHDLLYELSGRRSKLLEPPLVDYEKAAAPFMQHDSCHRHRRDQQQRNAGNEPFLLFGVELFTGGLFLAFRDGFAQVLACRFYLAVLGLFDGDHFLFLHRGSPGVLCVLLLINKTDIFHRM